MSENILRNLRPISNRTKQELIDDQFIPIDDRTQQELEDEDYLSYESENEDNKVTTEDDFDIDNFDKKTYRPVDNRTLEELIDDQFIPIDDRTQQELEDDHYLCYENESEVENIDLISAWDNKKKLYQNQVQLLNCLQTTTKKLKQETK